MLQFIFYFLLRLLVRIVRSHFRVLARLDCRKVRVDQLARNIRGAMRRRRKSHSALPTTEQKDISNEEPKFHRDQTLLRLHKPFVKRERSNSASSARSLTQKLLLSARLFARVERVKTARKDSRELRDNMNYRKHNANRAIKHLVTRKRDTRELLPRI